MVFFIVGVSAEPLSGSVRRAFSVGVQPHGVIGPRISGDESRAGFRTACTGRARGSPGDFPGPDGRTEASDDVPEISGVSHRGAFPSPLRPERFGPGRYGGIGRDSRAEALSPDLPSFDTGVPVRPK